METKSSIARGGMSDLQRNPGQVRLLDGQHIRIDQRRDQGRLRRRPVGHVPRAHLQAWTRETPRTQRSSVHIQRIRHVDGISSVHGQLRCNQVHRRSACTRSGGGIRTCQAYTTCCPPHDGCHTPGDEGGRELHHVIVAVRSPIPACPWDTPCGGRPPADRASRHGGRRPPTSRAALSQASPGWRAGGPAGVPAPHHAA